jgi:hypothetical protein
MPPVGFEPSVSAGERSKIYALRPCGHWDRDSILTVTKIVKMDLLHIWLGAP